MMRIFQICLGYEDVNDCDRMREHQSEVGPPWLIEGPQKQNSPPETFLTLR